MAEPRLYFVEGVRDAAKLEAIMLEFGARQGELVHAKKVLR